MKPVKCFFCSSLIYRDKEQFTQLNSGRYAHINCIDDRQKANEDRQKLLSYINDLFGERINFGIITKQIKNYIDNYKYSYSGIHGTLHYCYAIKKLEINRAEGIGIVPFYYNEARRYWLQVNEAKNQGIDFKIKKKTVNIHSPKLKPLNRNKPLTLEELEAELSDENI